jgi:nucleotide-binding universal stress UspA family protein
MKTILVGYDGTRHAERALNRAAELAQAFGSNVVVVSVAPPRPIEPIGATGAFGLMPYYSYRGEELAETAQRDEALWQQHRDRVQALFGDAAIPVDFAGVVGQPAEAIVEVADAQEADLIVVGTREPGFLERLLGGSVSEGVARRAHCDVLIVHPGDEGGGEGGQ